MGLSLTIKQRALQIGFDLAGIAPLSAWHDLEFARRWIERGYNGEMRYLANPQRQDPRRVLSSVKSVVCVGLIYNTSLPYSTEVGGQKSEARFPDTELRHPAPDTPRAWISRYAWGQDYHEVMRARLEQLRKALEELAPGAETRVYVDTGPLAERAFSRLSGIGWMGKNTCLINEEKGSWFFLGVILTSLEMEPDLPAPDRCGSCTACLEACPTGALVEPYVMDASRCISYFTIELKGAIPEAFRARIGANVFGCDICQDVCPWNSRQLSVVSSQSKSATSAPPAGRPAITNDPAFQPMTVAIRRAPTENAMRPNQETADGRRRTTDDLPGQADARASNFQFPVSDFKFPFSLFNPPLEALAALTEDDFRRLFAHSAIKRAKYRGWLRNLCVAMGNSGERRFVLWLERLAQHPDPILREHAVWALDRLSEIGRLP